MTIFGHLTPGGGFQGGAIIATGVAAIFIVLRVKFWNEKTLNLMKAFGGFGIAFLIFFGYMFRPFYIESQNLHKIWGGDYLLFLNIFCAIVVVSSLVLIIYSMVENE
jgi:multicomponent Na+:H+ antiporter subunit B